MNFIVEFRAHKLNPVEDICVFLIPINGFIHGCHTVKKQSLCNPVQKPLQIKSPPALHVFAVFKTHFKCKLEIKRKMRSCWTLVAGKPYCVFMCPHFLISHRSHELQHVRNSVNSYLALICNSSGQQRQSA